MDFFVKYTEMFVQDQANGSQTKNNKAVRQNPLQQNRGQALSSQGAQKMRLVAATSS